MPMLEAVSLLTALANAYQVLRGNRTESEAVEAQPAPSTELLLAYELARAAAEASSKRLDSIRSRMQGLVALSGISVIAAPAIIRLSGSYPGLDSALFLASLVSFAVISVATSVFRALSPRPEATPGEIHRNLLEQQDMHLVDGMLRSTRETFDRGEKFVQFGDQVLKLLSLVVSVQIILLIVWLPVSQ